MKLMVRTILGLCVLPWTTGCQTELPPQPLPRETPDDEDDGPDPFPFHTALDFIDSAPPFMTWAAS